MSTGSTGEREAQPGPRPRPGALPLRREGFQRRRSPGPRWLAGRAELVPGIAAIAVFLTWTSVDGGFFPTAYYPGALFLLGLLIALVYAYRDELVRLPGLAVVALGLLGAFALWNYLSILWADNPGNAWDGANRCLLYLTVFAVFALPAWRAETGAAVLGLFALSVAAVGGFVLVQAASSANPLDYFIAGRFAEPTSYHNANAAVFTLALFPSLFLASRREVPWPLRGLMLASAGILFELALLPQSRGWLIAAPIALLAYLALVPGRVRSLAVLAPLAAAALITADPALDVFDAVNASGDPAAALARARDAMLIAAGLLLVVGAVIGLIDRRLELAGPRLGVLKRAIGLATGAVALAGVIFALAVVGNPVNWVGDRWEEFKGGEFEHDFSGSRLAQGLGTNRYDFWGVAFDEFQEAPVLGVGSQNFAADYVRDRESTEEPFYPHNLPLEILSQTGLIGAALFAGFLIAALTAMVRGRRRRSDPLGRAVAAVSAVVLLYWLLHSSGDWFWAFPAVSAPVFAWLALGLRLSAEPVGDRQGPPASRSDAIGSWPQRPGWASRRAVTIPVLVGAALLATATLTLPWRAAVGIEAAAESWREDPDAAYERLDRARSLNFLSERPDLVAGAIASRLGDRTRMRAAFERALERDPENWYALLELAALDALKGDSDSALARLDEVATLNPREPTTELVRRGVLSGQPVSPAALDNAFRDRVCRRLGRRTTATGCKAG